MIELTPVPLAENKTLSGTALPTILGRDAVINCYQRVADLLRAQAPVVVIAQTQNGSEMPEGLDPQWVQQTLEQYPQNRNAYWVGRLADASLWPEFDLGTDTRQVVAVSIPEFAMTLFWAEDV